MGVTNAVVAETSQCESPGLVMNPALCLKRPCSFYVRPPRPAGQTHAGPAARAMMMLIHNGYPQKPDSRMPWSAVLSQHTLAMPRIARMSVARHRHARRRAAMRNFWSLSEASEPGVGAWIRVTIGVCGLGNSPRCRSFAYGKHWASTPSLCDTGTTIKLIPKHISAPAN